ncbi:chemotaxis protein CheB [Caulobacter segnis]
MGVADHFLESKTPCSLRCGEGRRRARIPRPGGRSCEFVRPRSMGRRRSSRRRRCCRRRRVPKGTKAMARTTETIVCVGASTGGTEALRGVPGARCRPDSPGVVIVQHMPEKLHRLVRQAAGQPVRGRGQGGRGPATPVRRGRVLIAPGKQAHPAGPAQRAATTTSRSRTGRWSRATGRRSTCCSARRRQLGGRRTRCG